jgi:hypothetical protein
MEDDELFEPSGVEVAISRDGKRVKIVFTREEDGKSQGVALERGQVPMLLAQLHRKTEPGQVVPIDRGSLKPGQSYETQAVQTTPIPGKGVVVTFWVSLTDQADRGVTIPFNLTSAQGRDLIRMLSDAVE